MHLITDLIIRMQPYAKELKELCALNADFAQALKSTHPKKFVSLGAIVTSYPPSPRGDEVIGFFVYDRDKDCNDPYRSATYDATNLYLKCSTASVAFKLIVF